MYAIKKNDTEEIRIEKKEYKGREYIDIRIYFKAEDSDSMIPSKKGITINPNQLGELAKGLQGIVATLEV